MPCSHPNRELLLVEDEFFVALDLQDMAEEAGFSVDGPYATVSEALTVAADRHVCCAILDVRLLDGEVGPLADMLYANDVPIVFHSGHVDNAELEKRYPEATICMKPSSPTRMKQILLELAS
ncbi:response regulator [Pararhizobium mangrovi]|uniref:Response regulator n=1 Tax=Pararhizobium mangrovi TaxID=2590452 RepID=A0A506TZI1_9HYPH|nr:response regulator [Pararhizobium mangrovi]TPW26135.1 response regulator [Pararhizobium mangrovi]